MKIEVIKRKIIQLKKKIREKISGNKVIDTEIVKEKAAWGIAKVLKPFYVRRELVKSKKFLISAGGVILTLSLILGVSNLPQNNVANNEVTLSNESTANVETRESTLSRTKAESLSMEKKEDIFQVLADQYIDLSNMDATTMKYYSLVVNDQPIALFNTKEEAEETLEGLKQKYIPEDDNIQVERIYFDEKIEIEETYKNIVEAQNVKTKEEALEYIIKGTDEEKKYKIQRGDSFWSLAKKFDISVNDLIKANPDIKPERLQIGQEVSLIVPEPLINVCTVENVTYTKNIQYDVVYEDNPNLYKEEYRIKQRGVYGKKEIKAELVKKDGQELGKVVLEEQVVSNPTTKVVYKGTKNPPPKKGTGVFAKPLNRGRITDPYGYRYHPITGRYSMHSGVDIAAPYGDNVLAADGGEVIFAGWKGTYGYCVIIDHGANKSSLYAHMSKLYVKKGQKVFKGKTIGAIGSTGRSTGSHLHFEIRKLGKSVNPKNYVNLPY